MIDRAALEAWLDERIETADRRYDEARRNDRDETAIREEERRETLRDVRIAFAYDTDPEPTEPGQVAIPKATGRAYDRAVIEAALTAQGRRRASRSAPENITAIVGPAAAVELRAAVLGLHEAVRGKLDDAGALAGAMRQWASETVQRARALEANGEDEVKL